MPSAPVVGSSRTTFLPRERSDSHALMCSLQADESLEKAQDAQRQQAAAAGRARRRGRGPAWPGRHLLGGLLNGAGLFGGPGLFGGGAGCAPAGGGIPAPAGPAQVEASGSGSSEDALIDLTLGADEPQAQRVQQTQQGRAGMQQTVKEEDEWEQEEVETAQAEEEGDEWKPDSGDGGDSDDPDDFGGEWKSALLRSVCAGGRRPVSAAACLAAFFSSRRAHHPAAHPGATPSLPICLPLPYSEGMGDDGQYHLAGDDGDRINRILTRFQVGGLNGSQPWPTPRDARVTLELATNEFSMV